MTMDEVYPRTLTDEEFVTLYRTLPNSEMCRILGKSKPTVARRARLLGVKKAPEVVAAHKRGIPRSAEFGARVAQRNRERVWTDEEREKLASKHRGKVVSEETRARMSAANSGKPKPDGFGAKVSAARKGWTMSDEQRAKLSGPNHYRWKGGIKKAGFTKRAEETPGLPAWRQAVLERDAYTCQDCQRVYAPGQPGLNAHHILDYETHIPERTNVENGMTLCQRCHLKRHRKAQQSAYIDTYERMEEVPCACGCGEMIYPITMDGTPKRYARYHSQRGRKRSPETNAKMSAALKGRVMPPDEYAALLERNRNPERNRKLSASLRGKPTWRGGWNNPHVTQDEFIALYPTMRSKDLAALCHFTSQASVTQWARKLNLPLRYKVSEK